MKKTFILHVDSLSILDDMTNEQKGILFDAIYKYQLGQNVELDFAMKMAFAPFKNQFVRDDESYQNVVERNRLNGKSGGRPKNNNPKNPVGFLETQKTQDNPKNLDSDNDNVSDSDSKNESVNENDLRNEKLIFLNALPQVIKNRLKQSNFTDTIIYKSKKGLVDLTSIFAESFYLDDKYKENICRKNYIKPEIYFKSVVEFGLELQSTHKYEENSTKNDFQRYFTYWISNKLYNQKPK